MTRNNSPQGKPPANAHQQPRWYDRVAAAFTQHMYLKGFGITIFISVFFVAYFYLLKHPAYPITVMPITLLDRLIGFQPAALPLYLSLWVYVSLPPAFFSTRRDLYSYGRAMAATCLTGLIAFYFWPTTVPPVDIDWTQYPDVHFLKNIDAAGNAFPSLHVATAVFSGVWLHHLLRRFDAPRWLQVINLLWGIGIVYSTLATRQHVAVDVFSGLALGVLAVWLSLRRRTIALP